MNLPCAQSRRALLLTAGTLLAMTLSLAVHAETVDCTPVTSLPAVIDTQGIYCLTGNLATSQNSGNAITINANNVTLDLNGWKVGGQAAGTATNAFGILSASSNVTVQNGIVRGFYAAIRLSGRGAVVRDMLLDQNAVYGIWLSGEGAVVEHNQIVDTGGSTISAYVGAIGIYTTGNGATVSDNAVSGLTGTFNVYGIYLAGSSSAARNNVVSNTVRPTGISSYGIYQLSNIVMNNIVSNFETCIFSGSEGLYAQNSVNDCTTNYSGGVAGAGNSP